MCLCCIVVTSGLLDLCSMVDGILSLPANLGTCGNARFLGGGGEIQ